MSIEIALAKEAEYAASNAQHRVAALELQLKEVERQKLEIEAKCQVASLAPKRLLKFQPKIGTEYQCPRCWISDERRSSLRPIPAIDDTDDTMVCRACGAEYLIPV